MKIAVCSDLHLEFDTLKLENTEGADVLVLSGDICVVAELLDHTDEPFQYGHAGIVHSRSMRLHEFFYNCCNYFPHVVYVVGNHEHYNYDFKYTVSDLKKRLKYLPNLQILEKETWTLHEEVTFIGGTLWTDMNKEDTFTMYHIKQGMNDFQCVKNSNRMVTRRVPIYEENLLWTEDGKNGPRYVKDEKGNMNPIAYKDKLEPSKFSPEDAVEEHKKMLEFIRHVTEGQYDKKFVVCGHHTPSPFSIHEKYAHAETMNGGYTSDLTEFILDRPMIKLWTHGHTHEDFDYMIGSTRVVCNPRGYAGYESRADRFQLKYVEV
mgnify:CR=1 FL=1